MKFDRDEAVKMILQSHEGLLPRWEEHLEFWGGDDPGITNDFSVYADYVAELVEGDNARELSIASELIEKFINEGDDNVEYGATIGFLEGITNTLSHKDHKLPHILIKYLQPKSRKFCKKLDKFWGTTTPGL